MKRHLALQEKNRRAQRRFRERQKQRVRSAHAQTAAACCLEQLAGSLWAVAVHKHLLTANIAMSPGAHAGHTALSLLFLSPGRRPASNG